MRAKDFRKQAWQNLSGKWGTMIAIYLLSVVIISASCIVAVGPLLLAGSLTLGFSIALLNAVRKQNVEVSNLFDGFKNFANALLGYILQAIFIFLWSLLFFIPGLVKSYSYSMMYYIMADDPTISANDAITKSRQMMNGNKWRLFCLDFSFIGWYLLSTLTLGLLLIIVVPYHQTARAEFYDSLVHKPAPEQNLLENSL